MKLSLLVFIIPFIILSLVLAIWAGWVRMGWTLPATSTTSHHGVLMVNSFLASLIFLERAVTFKEKWVLLVPFVNAISSLFFIAGHAQIACYLLLAGSLGFTSICLHFLYRYKHFYYFVFVAGGVCLLVGNLLLLVNSDYGNAVYWWMGFFLFTIVAERLELSRFLNLSAFKRLFLNICLAVFVLSLCLRHFNSNNIALALSFVLAAAWLLKFDMAKHAIKVKGQHRYSGILLLTGFGWLFITGILLLFYQSMVFAYDAILHSFFIGFVFSMIFAHAPIILPAIARLAIKIYRPILYLWFILLQFSLLLRLVGDIIGDIQLRMIGGVINGFVVLLFFVTIVIIVKIEQKKTTF